MAFGRQLVPAEHHLDGMSRALQRGRKLPERLDTAEGKPQGALLMALPSAPCVWPSGPCLTPTFIILAQAADKNSSGNKVLAHVSKPGTRVQSTGKGIIQIG